MREPPLAGAASRLKSGSVADFGEQWTHFRDNTGYYASTELFRDLLHPFFVPEDFRNGRVADVGSGTGRIVRMLADAGARQIIAVEPSAAFDVLKANTRDCSAVVTYVNDTGEQFAAEGLDFVTSIGVLHHVPDPAPVVDRMYLALRPGGHAIVWLYGREGNGLYLALARPVRWVTTRLPHRVLNALCHVIDWPLAAYVRACRVVPLPMWRYMRNHLGRLDPSMRRLTIYDQLNPKWAKYYTREEGRRLLESVGFVDVKLHHRHGYSWLVVGQKPVGEVAQPRAR